MSGISGSRLFRVSSFLLAAAISLGAEPARGQTTLADDFETGTALKTDNPAGRWDSQAGAAGNTVTVIAGARHRGNFGARFSDLSTTNSTQERSQIRLDWFPSTALTGDVHLRYWMRFTVTTGSANQLDLAGFDGTFAATGSSAFTQHLVSMQNPGMAGNVLLVGGHRGPNPPNWGSGTSAFQWTPNQWYLVESILTNVGSATSQHQVYVDGVLRQTLATNMSGAAVTFVEMGFTYGQNAFVGTLDVDDVRVGPALHASTVTVTGAATAPANSCVPLTLGLVTSTGVARTMPYNVQFDLSATGGTTFFSDAGCTSSAANVTVPAGASTGTLYARRATTGADTFTAASADFLPDTLSITWQPNPASKLAFTTPSRAFTAGTCGGAGSVITVQLQDAANGAVNAGGSGQNLTVSSSSLGTVTWFTNPGCTTVAPGGAFTIPSGSSTVDLYYRDTRSGSPSITVSNPSGLTTPTPQVQTVNAGAIASLTLAGYPSSTAAGMSHPFSVSALDGFGNPAAGYTGTVTVSTSAPSASMPAPFTFNGSQSSTVLNAALNTVGTQSLSVTDGTRSATQSNIQVSAASASTFVITGGPGPFDVGATMDLTLEARDAFGQRATGYLGTVHFTATDSAATLPADYTFTTGDSGRHTFQAGVTWRTAGPQSVSAADLGIQTLQGVLDEVVVRQSLGGGCTSTAECSAGTCVDGVCCSSACTDACMTCNGAGTAGTCTPLSDGTFCGAGGDACGLLATCQAGLCEPPPAEACFAINYRVGCGGCGASDGAAWWLVPLALGFVRRRRAG